jgi:hypothetical protein
MLLPIIVIASAEDKVDRMNSLSFLIRLTVLGLQTHCKQNISFEAPVASHHRILILCMSDRVFGQRSPFLITPLKGTENLLH